MTSITQLAHLIMLVASKAQPFDQAFRLINKMPLAERNVVGSCMQRVMRGRIWFNFGSL